MKKLFLFAFALAYTYLYTYSQEEKPVFTFSGHKGKVYAVTFTADDKTILSGGEDKTIQQWDIATGEQLKRVDAHYGDVREILCLKDGVTILSAGDVVIKSWNTLFEQQENQWKHYTHVWSFDISPDMRKMVSGAFEKKIYFWDLLNHELVDRLEGHEKTSLAVAYSPNGKHFASGSLDQKIKIWNAATLQVEKTCTGHAENIYDLEFTRNGNYLVSVSMDKMVKIWKVETGKHHKTLTGHTDAVMAVSIHPTDLFLATASFDGTIRLYDITTGGTIYSYIDHTGPVHDVAFSNNGNYFASASLDETVKLWKLSPKVIAEYFFPTELDKEWEANAVFGPKRPNESRNDYASREQRANEKREEIYLKYYQMYLDSQNNSGSK
jgi:WD40 repeat protein